MTHIEMAFQLTAKAMECGLIQPKPANHCNQNDPYTETTQVAIKQVSDFYKGVFQMLSSTT